MLVSRCVVLIVSSDVALGLSSQQVRNFPAGTPIATTNTVLVRKENSRNQISNENHNLTYTLGPATRKIPKRRSCPMDPITGHCKLKKHRDMKCTSLRRKGKARGKAAIPNQLILTGATESIDEINPQLRNGIDKVLSNNPWLKLRYLGDGACSRYVREHFKYLADDYDNEPRGEFRGDICRTVVLFHEGGYYMDLDLDLRTPLSELVDNQTSFVSAFSMTNAVARQRMYGGSMLNALMISVPNSKILASTLYHMISWYRGDPSVPWGQTASIYVGTVTLWRGLAGVMACNCPQERNLDQLWFDMKNETNQVPLQWSCGQDSIRLYMERRLQCKNISTECPEERANSTFDLVRYGIFEPGPARNLIAWSRPAWCNVPGCAGGGHSDRGS
jgi:hypothetical protein